MLGIKQFYMQWMLGKDEKSQWVVVVRAGYDKNNKWILLCILEICLKLLPKCNILITVYLFESLLGNRQNYSWNKGRGINELVCEQGCEYGKNISFIQIQWVINYMKNLCVVLLLQYIIIQSLVLFHCAETIGYTRKHCSWGDWQKKGEFLWV